MPPIRILVVDDSAVVRKVIKTAVSREADFEVIGTARNGEIALEKIERLKPDLVTLDLEMPVLDGLGTLRALRERCCATPVIVFSALSETGARVSIEALAQGARDCVTKPSSLNSPSEAIEHVQRELVPRARALCRRPDPQGAPPTLTPTPSPQRARSARSRPGAGAPPEVVAIGLSTGGPNALAELMAALPGDLPVPIVVVQHMPAFFTRQLAERLDRGSKLRVEEGQDGVAIERGAAYVAPGGQHMVLRREGLVVRIVTNLDPPENSCRPAVDPLFRSVAEIYGAATLAVIMTGMGSDGLRGCEEVRRAGGQIVVQDEPSSVVWGMPGYVAEAGLADAVLPLDALAAEIALRAGSGKS